MTNELLFILTATSSISFIALISAMVITTRNLSKNGIMALVAVAAGTMLSTAWLHFLPEAVHDLGETLPFQLFMGSFVAFFVLEKLLNWHHCHEPHCHKHTFGYINLVGDAVHNFIDGLVIAAAFLVDFHLGVATTVAVALHEIPQEIGDLGVILLAGFSKAQAVILNFSVALTVVLGGLAGYTFAQNIHDFSFYLLPIAAGGFTYLAATDLIPQIHHTKKSWHSLVLILLFMFGLLLNPISQALLPNLEHQHGAQDTVNTQGEHQHSEHEIDEPTVEDDHDHLQ